MEHQRPRGREKNVSGPGKSVQKRGEGLHTGPVGESGGHGRNQQQNGGPRSAGARSGGGMKLILLLLLVLCDLLARTLFRPYELPVGVVMSLAGGPFFIWLLFRQRGGRTHA